MVYGAIKGMVNAIDDPYTVFLPPKENRVVQEDLKGSFEGVGIQIGFRGNQLAVVSPLPDSPAEEAGVLAGDYIIGIKDELKEIDRGTTGITLPEAVQAIRGPAGSVVTLILLRNGSEEPITVDIVRASIDIPSLILDFVGPNENIAHIRLLKFGGETKAEWERAVRNILKRRNLTGIILDVRNNPGGYLQGSVDVASEFLRNGSVVVIEEKSNGERDEFKVERIGRFPDTPVVVLVNKGSASASEILAGALRDIRGVQLVGETSFGKGTIQEPQQIENGAGLHITVARWLTPSGFWVNEGGLEPDVELGDDPETIEDEQLQEAIRLLTGD
jgi:carboxyl-terminal processing protease